jgi:hypothetical protein
MSAFLLINGVIAFRQIDRAGFLFLAFTGFLTPEHWVLLCYSQPNPKSYYARALDSP